MTPEPKATMATSAKGLLLGSGNLFLMASPVFSLLLHYMRLRPPLLPILPKFSRFRKKHRSRMHRHYGSSEEVMPPRRFPLRKPRRFSLHPHALTVGRKGERRRGRYSGLLPQEKGFLRWSRGRFLQPTFWHHHRGARFSASGR